MISTQMYQINLLEQKPWNWNYLLLVYNLKPIKMTMSLQQIGYVCL